MPTLPFRSSSIFLCLLLVAGASGCASTRGDGARPDPDPVLDYLELKSDPIEPFNRGSFAVSDRAMRWIVTPVGDGYSFVVREPVRKSVRRFRKNLTYPMRLINTLLQGKVKGAGEETGRFVVNTTVGLLGFFDPATRWGLKAHEEDFGQTFAVWGVGDGFYLFIPLVGPSTGRDAVGRVGDTLANPATWLLPGLGIYLAFNDVTFQTGNYNRLVESQSDPYVLLREMHGVVRERAIADYEIPESAFELTPSPTLEGALLNVQQSAFRRGARVQRARIEATGRKFPYTIWRNPESDTVIFVLGGLGAHRNALMVQAVGEIIHEAGFTAVAVSTPFNWEFIDRAATTAVPGYTPVDAGEVNRALAAVWADLQRREDGRYRQAVLVGLSLGGLQALHIAAESMESIEPDREGIAAPESPPYSLFVALSPPVDPVFALGQLDAFFEAPLVWSEEERGRRMREAMFKAAALAERGVADLPGLPFDEAESEFLIGLGYRYLLRNTIFATHRREDLGVLRNPYRWSRREALYDEIAGYGFADYMEKLVMPYTERQIGAGRRQEELVEAAGLRGLEPALSGNRRVWAVVNQNDFVSGDADLAWLRRVLGPRLILFPDGGHLGNLHREEVQAALVRMLRAVSPPGENP
jgi:ABC-type transporter lipoprotein component MlaA/pimeloyl-ACP methyl ester carboxylesterase